MNKTTKLTALFFAVLLAAYSVSSCSSAEKTGENDTTDAVSVPETTAAVTEPALSDDLPEMDFGGYEFQILSSQTTSQHAITAINEQTGDVLNDAMYNRTRAVEEKYNIVFLDDYLPGDAWVANDVFANSVKAGDSAYDLAMLLERGAFSMTHEGYFLDFSTVENVNLSKPYWNQNINETINLSDAVYMTYGSAQLCLYDLTFVLLFNQKMIGDLGLENPFDLVLDGTWTFDKMYEMGKAAVKDVDGDGKWGERDIYALEGANNSLSMSYLASARQRTIEKNGSDIEICLLTNPLIEEIFTRIMDICHEPGYCYQKPLHQDTYFHVGQALFADHTFYSIIGLRDMEDDFGIIPFPKYTQDQEDYGVFLSAGTRTMVVPTTAEKPELSGAVLETLHYLSYEDVMPAYYEVTLKEKVSRDSVSSQMLDLIMDSIYYDLGMTMFNDYIKDPIFTTLFNANRDAYVSTVNKRMKAIESAIADAQSRNQ